jgi:hypothetical protein
MKIKATSRSRIVSRAGSPKVACCEMLCTTLDDSTIPVIFIAKLREYGVSVMDGGASYIRMKYCPWCGKSFPESLRSRWLTEIRKLGFEPGDKGIPREYLDDRWYKKG